MILFLQWFVCIDCAMGSTHGANRNEIIIYEMKLHVCIGRGIELTAEGTKTDSVVLHINMYSRYVRLAHSRLYIVHTATFTL